MSVIDVQEIPQPAGNHTINEVKPETFDFPEAMRKIIDGKVVHKLEWENKERYVLLHDGWLTYHKEDGKFYVWKVNDGDMTGEDYIVLV